MLSKPSMASLQVQLPLLQVQAQVQLHSSISTHGHGVNPSLLLLSNMVNMMTVKLDYNNYLV